MIHTDRDILWTESEKGGANVEEEELLQYLCKTADMGCEGIVSVLDYVENADLRHLLEDQLKEYQKIRREAVKLLADHGLEPEGAGVMAKMSAEVMSAGKLLLDRSTSRIAEMTIQGTAMGVSKTIKHLNDFAGEGPTKELARRLLTVEEAAVERLKAFL